MTGASTIDSTIEPRWRMVPPAGLDIDRNVPRRRNPAGHTNGSDSYWLALESRSGVSQGDRPFAGTDSVVSSWPLFAGQAAGVRVGGSAVDGSVLVGVLEVRNASQELGVRVSSVSVGSEPSAEASAGSGRGQRRQRLALTTATSSAAPMARAAPVVSGRVRSAVW